MKTLIVYGSKYGAAGECAKRLAALLDGEVTVSNAKQRPPAPEGFDRVVIGSGVYASMLRKEVKQYCAQHAKALEAMPLGLYVCCADPGQLEEYLKVNVASLLPHAKAAVCLGGELRMDKMNFAERFIIKQIGKSKDGGMAPRINEEAIQQLATAMQI